MSGPESASSPPKKPAGLKRALGLWGLILYGIIVIQPTAPMSPFGEVSNKAHGHVVTAVLIAMVAMLFTAFSYGRMARVYPSAGSAYTFVSRGVHPLPGYLTGWSMAMDYILNPLICTIVCSDLIVNYLPLPHSMWIVLFAVLFVSLNLVGIKTNEKINATLAAFMVAVIGAVLWAAFRFVAELPAIPAGLLTRPFYDPQTFEWRTLLGGTSIAVLTYIGFDGISTLSEEVENPRRNVLLATVLTCLFTGILASLQVYAAQLAWPEGVFPESRVVSAYADAVGRLGGPWLSSTVGITLIVATIGSGMASMLGAARLLYGMGRDAALPRRFFGYVNERGVPRNNVLLVGSIALVGAFLMNFGAAVALLNFGALVAFMGVNVAAFNHYVIRERRRTLGMILPPVLGFLSCLAIWLGLSGTAKIWGFSWLAVGLLYGLVMRRSTGRWSLGEMTEG